jgi:short-subunit dehydrogenase
MRPLPYLAETLMMQHGFQRQRGPGDRSKPGIGKAIAQQFAAQGVKVILVSRHREQLKQLEETLRMAGGDAIAIAADIADPQDVQALAREVSVIYGRVDILINNATVATLKPLVQNALDE